MTDDDPIGNTELDLAEAMRWCWRHFATVDFDTDEDDFPVMTLITPLRHPEGELDKAVCRCTRQSNVEALMIKMVGSARERLNLE